MKHTRFHARLLSVLLTAALLLSLLVPAAYAVPGKETEAQSLELTDLDPATLHVRKLGELTEDPTSQPEEQSPYAMTDLVRVSIVLDEPAALDAGWSADDAADAAVTAYRAQLRTRQDAVQAKIETAIGSTLDVRWNLTLAMNLISANLRYGDLETVKAVPGVKDVFVEARYEAPVDVSDGETAEPNTANSSEYMVGAVASWLAGYTGAGHTVAIIDTGVDYEHQSFNADACNHAIAETGKTVNLMTSSSYSNLSLNGNGRYVSAKIPFGYNYVDQTNTLTALGHMSDTMGEHGSHVAGISAANRFIKSGSSYNDAASTVHAVGMAPDAQILIMKVFGAGGGAYDSDYMAAIEDCLTMGVDVCNLSLGSSAPGFSVSETYQNVLNKIANGTQNTKLVVSISAGNAGAFADNLQTDLYIDDIYMHTGGSPGSFLNSLCVAAAQNTGATGTPLTYNGQNMFYTETDPGSTSRAKMTTVAGTWNFVYIDAVGEASDYSTVNSAVSLSGKLVIVNRGSLSFVEKGNNAISYSPKALIVANNDAGTINMSLDDYTGSFPMVSITLADAETIKATAASGTADGITYYTGSITVTTAIQHGEITDNAEVTSFSSWGAPGALTMKPEITAPGGDIYSVFGSNKTSSGSTAGGSDQYESMSGTSMAAPHITGLTAVLAQYIEENNVSVSGYTTRQLIQSLLMSTAVPMHIGSDDGPYYSILQQGAGLANVYQTIQAKSAIFMGADATVSYADGKVKAELGDKPSRSGVYSYSFDIHNMSDEALCYELDTDLFTQDRYEDQDGYFHMDYATTGLEDYGWTVSYAYEGAAVESHDVDLDGYTTAADADAILAYLAGNTPAADLDLSVADMDQDGAVSSRDAYILLDWQPQAASEALVVPAHSSKTVTVTIHVPADTTDMDADYPSGAYLEGFTYVRCVSETKDGALEDVTHSIPILGFYGSWTDPSMFDNMSYVDELYGETRVPYSGSTNTNYLTVTYSGSPAKFSGNPYMVEDEFPADRLALSTGSNIGNIFYNLIRSAGTTGFAATKLNADHEVTNVLASSIIANNVTGQWFNESQGAWQNTGTKFYSANRSVASFGLSEGDLFRVGFYAIPEYNAMKLNSDYTSSAAGMLDNAGFQTLLTQNVLGKGAFVGYDFTVDNTAPVISDAELSNSTLTVSASDNLNLAYVAVLSLDGETVYAEQAPGAPTASITLDATAAINNARGYVAVFAGDYAGNEAAVAVKVNDNCYEDKTIYVLTDELVEGNDYLICEVNVAGTGHILGYTAGSWSNTVTANAVTVKLGDSSTGNKPYIEPTDVADTAVWTASSGIKLMNGSNYLRHTSTTSNTLNISTTNSYNSWTYNNSTSSYPNTLQVNSRYMRYYNSSFSLNTATSNRIYLYVKTTVHTEVDPYNPTSIKLTPESLDLYKGNEADLVAKVLPLTATDRSVTWSSSNSSVATVDQNGHVVAVGSGSAVITVTANGNSAVQANCAVNVTVVNKDLNGIIWDEGGGIYFSTFNSNSLPTWTKSHNDAKNVQLASAFMQSTSALYAATLDSSSAETVLYSVNRSSYALTEYGVNYLWATDMALAASTYSQYVGMAYTFAYYLMGGPIEPGDDGEGGTYCGLPYAALDCSSVTDGAYFVGIATKSRSAQGGTFYALDENGVLWQTTLALNSQQNGFEFSTPTKVLETGIGTSFLYQNLYYDGTWLYWGHQADNIAELILINPSTGKVYHAGNFGEGVWPATGFYKNGSVAPSSAEEPAEVLSLDLKPVAARDELMTQEIMARFFDEAKKADKNEPANELVGGLNAVKPSAKVRNASGSTGEAENGAASVTVTDTENVNNGVITMTYDPAVLTYTGYSSDFAHISVWNDAANGVIKLAYADLSAHKDIAVVNFSYNGDTLNTVVTVNSLERNTELALEEYLEIQLKAGSKPVSVYVVDELDGASVYAWAWGSAGNLDAQWPGHALTAEGTEKSGHSYYKIDLDLVDYDKIIFNRNGQPQTATLNVAADAGDNDYVVYYIYGESGNDLQTSQGTDIWPAPGVVTEPTCTEPGYTTYTGMFTELTVTGNETPALGHAPLAAVAENNVEPSCTAAGSYDSVVYCERCNAELSRETVTVAALDHLPGEAVQENYVEPTATEYGGYDTVVYCQRCNAELSREHTVLEPTGTPEPELNEDLSFYTSISIGVEIKTTFTIRQNVLNGYASWYLEVSKLDDQGEPTETKRFGEGQEGAVTNVNNVAWRAVYTDITAKEMGVTFAATLHVFDANGQEYYSNTVTNTVKDYIVGELVKTDNENAVRTLCADMLNYGAAAQNYFVYDTDNLVNENLSAAAAAALDQFETKTEAPATLVNGSNGPNLYGSVSIKNRVVLSITARNLGAEGTVQIQVKKQGSNEVKEILETTKVGSVYSAKFSNVEANEMRDMFEFTALVDGVETGTPLLWSVDGYVRAARLNTDTSAEELALLNALLIYTDSAAAVMS